jgi:glycosyltransferase involved in cell wall biosynthesis
MIEAFHFILDHRIGGPHIYVSNLIKKINSEINSIIVTTGRGPFTEIALINLRHHNKILYPIEVIINTVLLLWKFKGKDKSKEIVFCVHGAANIAPIITARFLSLPVVWYFHETLGNFNGLVWIGKKIANKKNTKYVVVAEKTKEIYQLSEVHHIPSGIDVNFWSAPNKKIVPNNPIRLLSIGNINPLKGYDILLHALAKIDFKFQLQIIGATLETYTEYFESIKSQAKQLSRFGNEIQFLGWQSEYQIKQSLEQANFYLLPSRSEACPIALLEAMSMCCPCIATEVGDVPKIITNGVDGLLVEPYNSQMLAEAISEMAGFSHEKRYNMGLAARMRVVQLCSIEHLAKQHLKLYQQFFD